MLNIKVHTTKEQIEALKAALLPLKYDEQGNQYREVPTWMLILYYMSSESDSVDRLAAQVLYG